MICKIIIRCGCCTLTCYKADEILEYPSADYTVIRQNNYRHKSCDCTERSELFVKLTVCGKRRLLCFSTKCNFCNQKCKSECKSQDDVTKNKKSTVIFSCQIRKSPNVAKTYGTSRCCKNEADRAFEAASFFFHFSSPSLT